MDEELQKILGQEDIDKLIEAAAKGEIDLSEVEEKKEEKPAAPIFDEEELKIIFQHKRPEGKKPKIKPYDFKRPDKFAKEHLRTLRKIHENFARTLSTSLSTILRTVVKISVASVEQMTFGEFLNTVPSPTLLVIHTVGGMLSGSAILQISLEITFAVMDRLLGGPGTVLVEKRPLTSLEEPVAKRIAKIFFEHLKEAWSGVVKISPQIDTLEYNPQFAHIIPANDMVLVVSFAAKMLDIEGLFSICIPHIVLEPIMDKLSAQYFYSSTAQAMSIQDLQALESYTLDTMVEIRAILGESYPTLKEVLMLKEGDVIVLKRRVGEDIDVEINGVKKMKAAIGKVGKFYGIKITSLPKRLIEEVSEGGV